jgi:plastocyanin
MVNHKIFLLILAIFLFMGGPLQVNPEETLTSPQLIAQIMRTPRVYIITVQGKFSDSHFLTKLDPREISVGRGDPVTWINESQTEVKIKFGKGAQCRKVSVKSMGWRLEPDKCYETEDTLKPGDSTTIHFKEIGLFNYEIAYVDQNRKEMGVIHVQTEQR